MIVYKLEKRFFDIRLKIKKNKMCMNLHVKCPK